MQFIPVHPAQNLHLSDGVYVAEIGDVEERVYKVDSRLIHVLLWLPEEVPTEAVAFVSSSRS